MLYEKSMLREAFDLADQGFHVFPLKPGTKRPATPNGLKDATSDTDVVERWWEQLPNANIGLRTDGFVVIDIDPGAEWPGNPDRELELSAAPTVATPRGGRHHFYVDTTGSLRNTAGKIAAHVDTRATGGYVVAVPSVVNDKPYRWLTPLDGFDDVPEPPPWLLQALHGTNGASPSIEIPHTLRTHPGASEGHRNQALCHLVGMHLAEHGATTDLPQLALDWSRRCRPPMPDQQVIKSTEALIRKHQASSPSKAQASPAVSMTLRTFAEIEIEPVRWLWKGRIPRGKVSLLTGDPGLGKTFATIDIAAHVTTGTPFADGSSCPLGRAIFYSLEDAASDTLKPRAIAAGANTERLIEMGTVRRQNGVEDVFQFDKDIELLRSTLAQIPDVLLLVVDPLTAALGDSVNDCRNGDVRRVLGPLAKLAEETGVTILGITHSPKGTEGRKAVHRTIGSIAFVAAARVAWCVVADPNDEQRRLMLPQKNNLAHTPGMAFRLRSTTVEGCETAAVEWESDPVTIRLDDLDCGDRSSPAFDEAVEWLKATLTAPTPATDVRKLAKADGISDATLRRAKQSLGILSQRHGEAGEKGKGIWHWFPPPQVVIGTPEPFRF